MRTYEAKFSIGDQVTVKHDTTKDVHTVKGIYFDANCIQYFVSNFKSSGYAEEKDITAVDVPTAPEPQMENFRL